MKSFPRLLPFVFLAFASAAATPAADQRTYSSGSFQILIDGVAYDNVRSSTGGEFVADLVVEANAGSAAPKKHVSNLHVKPLRVEFAPSNSAGLAALVNEALGNQSTTHTVTVVTTSSSGQAQTATNYLNAVVTGLALTELDGASKNAASLTLTFEPEQVRSAAVPTVSARSGAQQAKVLASNFRFALGSLPCARVATIAALSAQRAASTDSVGVEREPTANPGKLTFSNLVITVSNADLAAWRTWADNWMVQGHHLEADEMSASLVLLGPDMSTTVLPIDFSHVGLVRLSPEPYSASTSSVSRFEVELYFESAAVAAGGASSPAADSTSSGSPPGTPPATSPAATTDSTPGTAPNSDTGTSQPASTGTTSSSDSGGTSTTGTGSGSLAGATSTSATPTKDLTAATFNPARQAAVSTTLTPRTTELTPVSNSPIAAATAGTTPASSGDPADQGARDPREFPRIDGLVRKSYASYDREGESEETVTYLAKAGIDDVLGRYESTMKSAGWEEASKNESGSASDFTHYYHLKWTKTVQEVDLRFNQTKAGGTELVIAVYSHRVGNLSSLTAALKGTASEAVAAEGSPNDMGARDPADFPRIARATRKSYSASGNASSPDETAVYRAKVAITSVEAFFVNQLTQADWEQVDRREGGDPLGGTHDITLRWTRGKRAAKILLKEIEPAITEITVWLGASG